MLYLRMFKFHLQNNDHPSFCSILLHSAVSGRFHIIFCMCDGLATYCILLESSLQEIFEGACFTCVFLSFTCENKDHPSFFHITVFCSKRKVSYHFLHVWWFCNILYTVRKLSSRDLRGCMICLCIFKFHLQKQGSSIIFFISLYSAVSRRFHIIFCMSDGFATYYTPLESSLQENFEGSWFACLFLSFTCANKDHSSFFTYHCILQ